MTPSVPQPAPPESPGKRGSSLSPVLIGCGGAVLVLLALAVLGIVIGWQRFVSYGISSDFTEYQAKIRSMQLEPDVKTPLLEKLDSLRQKARTSPISFWRWVDYDESVESLIGDERLTPDEVQALNRELDRMEAEFR